MVSYSTNFGNCGGSVLKIYGDEGTIDLTNWTAPTYSVGRGHQAQQAAQGGHARRAGRDPRPLPRLAAVPAHPQDDQRARSRPATTTPSR